MENIPFILFTITVIGILLFFASRMFRYGGVKGAMFGAHIDHTAGEVRGEKQGPVSTLLKVHVLSRKPGEKLIGLEYVGKSFSSYDMMPITLSLAETQKLISLLSEAARDKKVT